MTTTDVGRLIFGCNALSTLPTRREAFRLLDAAVECGIRHFDTARSYGRGFSERVLGEFLAGQGDHLRVTTKSGPSADRLDFLPTRIALPLNSLKRRRRVVGSAGPHRIPTRSITREELERSVEASLQWLRRSRIDVFLLHEGLPSQLDDRARDFITGMRGAGTLGMFGIGTSRTTIEEHYAADPICEVLQYDGPPDGGGVLLERYPHLLHVHHSIFRSPPRISHADTIRDALTGNPAGRVVFGTRSPAHLRANVAPSRPVTADGVAPLPHVTPRSP